jgi:hypothetical protein
MQLEPVRVSWGKPGLSSCAGLSTSDTEPHARSLRLHQMPFDLRDCSASAAAACPTALPRLPRSVSAQRIGRLAFVPARRTRMDNRRMAGRPCQSIQPFFASGEGLRSRKEEYRFRNGRGPHRDCSRFCRLAAQVHSTGDSGQEQRSQNISSDSMPIRGDCLTPSMIGKAHSMPSMAKEQSRDGFPAADEISRPPTMTPLDRFAKWDPQSAIKKFWLRKKVELTRLSRYSLRSV